MPLILKKICNFVVLNKSATNRNMAETLKKPQSAWEVYHKEAFLHIREELPGVWESHIKSERQSGNKGKILLEARHAEGIFAYMPANFDELVKRGFLDDADISDVNRFSEYMRLAKDHYRTVIGMPSDVKARWLMLEFPVPDSAQPEPAAKCRQADRINFEAMLEDVINQVKGKAQ